MRLNDEVRGLAERAPRGTATRFAGAPERAPGNGGERLAPSAPSGRSGRFIPFRAYR